MIAEIFDKTNPQFLFIPQSKNVVYIHCIKLVLDLSYFQHYSWWIPIQIQAGVRAVTGILEENWKCDEKSLNKRGSTVCTQDIHWTILYKIRELPCVQKGIPPKETFVAAVFYYWHRWIISCCHWKQALNINWGS